MSTPAEIRLELPGPAGALQAVWWPQPGAGGRAAVVCHPHPLHGGTMDNKVVMTVARACREAGLPVLRFNFRGTAGSAGRHDHGRGEVDDLLAALDWLAAQGVREVWLAGFSFGAWVCAAALARWPAGLVLQQLVLVAPPVHYEGFAAVRLPPGSRVLMGDADEVVDPEAMAEWARAQPGVELEVFAGVGHFFHGQLTALKASLLRGLPGTA